MKITQADTPTIWMDCPLSRLISAPISVIPTIFTLDALPDTTLPIYTGLGQAADMLACIPGGLFSYHKRNIVKYMVCFINNVTLYKLVLQPILQKTCTFTAQRIIQ